MGCKTNNAQVLKREFVHARLCFSFLRHKRSMGLTLAKDELTRIDNERVRDRVALERERSCSEHIISKINEVL